MSPLPSPPPPLPPPPPSPSPLPFLPPPPETVTEGLRYELMKTYIHNVNMSDKDGMQVDTRMVQLKGDASDELRELNYYTSLETVEEFGDEIESVSLKQVMNIISAAMPGTCISIAGPRGIGKTTFIRRMCHCWALGYVLRQYRLLFSIDLSTAAVDQPFKHSLISLLTAALTSTQAFTKAENKCILRNVMGNESRRVLIVLDHFSQQHSRLLSNILSSKQVTVVVSSSHPVKYVRCEHYFHILGLTDRQISQQVLHYCHSDHNRAEHFLQYLSSVPNFSILKRVPVYMYGLLCVFDSISTAHPPNTLMNFLSCLACLMLNLSQSELNQTAELLTSKSILEILSTPPSSSWPLFQRVCWIFYRRSKSLFHRTELVNWPAVLPLMRPVHVALPLQSGEWLLLTRYPLLQDFLASLHLCGLWQPVEKTLQYLDTHKEVCYFCCKLMPHVQTEVEKRAKVKSVVAESYEDDYIPDSNSESLVVSHTAVSARVMYRLISTARMVTFTMCDFSPAAATILSSSIGHGSRVCTLSSDRSWLEYVRCVACILYSTEVLLCCICAHFLSPEARVLLVNPVDSDVHPLVLTNRSVTSSARLAVILFWFSVTYH